MVLNRPTRASTQVTHPAIRITVHRESVEVMAPQAFRDAQRSVFDEFVRRVAPHPLVRSVQLDRPIGRVIVRFDGERFGAAEVLEAMARALSGGDANCGAMQQSAPDSMMGAAFGTALRIDPRSHREPLPGSRPADAWTIKPCEGAVSGQWALGSHVVTTTDAVDGDRIGLRGRVKRALNLAAAGGCFVMSFVGLVTPGIPTVPFVLATSYFLVRSSPTLDARLKRSRLFGPMLRDWENHGGIRRSTKVKIVFVTVAIMAVTVAFAGLSWPILLVACLMGTLGTAVLLRLPTIPENAPA